MPYYHIVFANNEIISCVETDVTLNKKNHLEQNNGKITYAIVKADDEDHADEVVKRLIIRAKKKMT